jgi:hypothetical protein
MHANKGKTTIEDAISKCMEEGTSESLQELSELIREQEYMQENKHSLYKIIIKHLGAGATTSTLGVLENSQQT